MVQLFNTENYQNVCNLGKYIYNDKKLKSSFVVTDNIYCA